MSLGLQQVLAQHLPHYGSQHPLDARRLRVCEHIQQCRTAALGGLQLACSHCDYDRPHYFACRDRHCPLCQQRASEQWADRQQQAVLPTPYYHLVFTLPSALNGWIQLHPEVLYRTLFAAAWYTLKTFAADPKRLGGQLGMTAMLHTWGQTLTQHVHLHCLVPGGAFTEQGSWKAAKSHYLFPVRALSRHFRGHMVSRLRALFKANALNRITASEVAPRLDEVMDKEWVVFSRPCERSTRQVVNYLARYSHRTAISNHRLLSMDEDSINFRYKDYRDQDKQKVMSLSHEEFIRRFLLHVLPKGLMRIRHFGYLANCCRKRRLPDIRRAIAEATTAEQTQAVPENPTGVGVTSWPCPDCQVGRLYSVGEIAPKRLNGG